MDPKPSFLGGGAGNLLRPRITAQLHSRGLAHWEGSEKLSFTKLGTRKNGYFHIPTQPSSGGGMQFSGAKGDINMGRKP